MKNILTFIIIGMFYLSLEILTRTISKDLVGINNWTIYSLVGWTSLWMVLIGGLCGYIIGILNENKKYWKVPMIIQSLIGTLIVLSIELISGYFLNILLKLNIWDYSKLKFNLLGQICLRNGCLFFMLIPFVIWFDDLIRCGLYKNKSVYPIYENYKRLFTLK